MSPPPDPALAGGRPHGRAMVVLHTAAGLRAFRDALPASVSVGFVPTMGGLHAGHLALVSAAVERCTVVIASVFVNPAQFAPHEDLASYPRPLSADLAALSAADTDAVYVPSPGEIYPPHFSTAIDTPVGRAGHNRVAEGAERPTFFRGVATVLLPLLTAVRPDALFAGQKDAQQVAVMRALSADLWLGCSVTVVPIVRAADGLALSSRNAYLSPAEREAAPMLFQALCRAQRAFLAGERDANRLRKTVEKCVLGECRCPLGVKFELAYVSVCDARSMREIDGAVAEEQEALVCIAGMIGKTRLIDNVRLSDEGVLFVTECGGLRTREHEQF